MYLKPYQPFHSTWGEHRPLTIFLHFLLSWAWVSASFRPWSLRANLFCICSCLAFKISCSSGSFCCQCFCNRCSFSEIGLSALSLTPNLEDQGLLSVRILLINLLQHGWTLLAQLHVSSDHGPGELRGSGSPSHPNVKLPVFLFLSLYFFLVKLPVKGRNKEKEIKRKKFQN